VKVALATSMVWSLGVWWIGEGFGGVFSGQANPVTGAPGAVILYGLLAVLLWPADRPGPEAPFVAGWAVGTTLAKSLWLVLWGSLSYFAVLGATALVVASTHGGWTVVGTPTRGGISHRHVRDHGVHARPDAVMGGTDR